MSGLTSKEVSSNSKGKKTLTRAAMVVAGVLLLAFIAKNTVLNNGFAEEESIPATSASSETANPASFTETGLPKYQPRQKLELTIKAKSSAKGAGVVVIADGDTLFDRKMRGGEVYTWNSNYRFKLDISNKDQVEIFIGGQLLQTPEGSGKRVKDLEITQLNYEEMLAPSVTTAKTK